MTQMKYLQNRSVLYLTNIESRLVVARVGWRELGRGIRRCKLLYLGWIRSKVLLYSTGIYTQYLVINIMGKNMKKKVDT